MFFKKSQQGFSLLELMVVITIFLIITSVVMGDIPKIGRKGALELTAQEVAGCIRAAQTYGTSARVVDGGSQAGPQPVGASLDPTGNKIVIFADIGESPNELDGGDSVVETCSLDGYSFELLGEGDQPFSDLPLYLIYAPTNYQVDTMSTLEPSFYNGNGETVTQSFVKIKIKSLRNNEYWCVRAYANGQIMVGNCE